eukprot:scaffold35318_cov50-Prasinocladus_malaysianus.AAC.1
MNGILTHVGTDKGIGSSAIRASGPQSVDHRLQDSSPVWVLDAVESKGRSWPAVEDFLLKMVAEEKAKLTKADIDAGVRRVLNVLPDLDAPLFPKQLGSLLGKL